MIVIDQDTPRWIRELERFIHVKSLLLVLGGGLAGAWAGFSVASAVIPAPGDISEQGGRFVLTLYSPFAVLGSVGGVFLGKLVANLWAGD